MIRLHKSYPSEPVKGKVILPSSKSETNRALMLMAYAGKEKIVKNISKAGDTKVLLSVLKSIEAGKSMINVKDAGTVGRFILPYLCMKNGNWQVSGKGRMKHRPYAELLNALRALGADIHSRKNEGFLPVEIAGGNLNGGEVELSGADSSQFISALMLAAPFLRGGLKIRLTGRAVSFSYLQLTQKVMEAFGARVKLSDEIITIEEGLDDLPASYTIEADWSSAVFWLAALALLPAGSAIKFPYLNPESVQGDRAFVQFVNQFGVEGKMKGNVYIAQRVKELTPPCTEWNMNSMPDAVPAAAVLCSLAEVPARFIGIDHLRFKESNRLEALKRELSKLNTTFVQVDEGWDLKPGKLPENANLHFNVYKDHRMAMALTLVNLKYDNIILNTPKTVSAKSYPDFWSDWRSIFKTDKTKRNRNT